MKICVIKAAMQIVKNKQEIAIFRVFSPKNRRLEALIYFQVRLAVSFLKKKREKKKLYNKVDNASICKAVIHGLGNQGCDVK